MRRPRLLASIFRPRSQTVIGEGLGRRRLGSASQAADAWRRDAQDGRGLGSWTGDRGPTEAERTRAVRMSRQENKRSGLYGQLIDTLVDFVVGDGIQIEAPSQDVKDYLDSVLDDPVNRVHRQWRGWFRDALVDGEKLISVTLVHRDAQQVSGRTKRTYASRALIGTMEPDDIRALHVSRTNHDRVLGLTYRHPEDLQDVDYPVANPTSFEPHDNGDGTSTVLAYWRMNALGRRGLPYLTRLIDKASLLDTTVDELARKVEYTNRFWLHGKVQASAPNVAQKIEQLETRLANAEPGEAIVTTDDVEIGAPTPDLKLPDQQASYELVLDYSLGSGGFPRHWFSSGGDTNRATAVEQGTPIHRRVDALQAWLRDQVEDLLAYLVHVGKLTGAIPREAASEAHAVMADIATRDSLRDVQEISTVSGAMAEAETMGAISAVEAQRIVRAVIASKSYGEQLDDEAPPLPEQTEVDTSQLPGGDLEQPDALAGDSATGRADRLGAPTNGRAF